jgi:hypothetical protein
VNVRRGQSLEGEGVLRFSSSRGRGWRVWGGECIHSLGIETRRKTVRRRKPRVLWDAERREIKKLNECRGRVDLAEKKTGQTKNEVHEKETQSEGGYPFFQQYFVSNLHRGHR